MVKDEEPRRGKYKDKDRDSENRGATTLVRIGDTHTERYAIACLLAHGEKVMETYSDLGLNSEMFTTPELGTVFSAANELFISSRPIGVYAVQQFLRESGDFDRVGGAVLFSTLLENRDDITSTEAATYAKNIIGIHKRRQVLSSLIEAQDLIARTDRDLGVVSGQIGDLLYGSLEDTGGERGVVHVGQVTDIVYHDLMNRREHPELYPTLKTGLSRLDYILIGLKPQALYIIAARPGKGKTALALSVAHFVAKVVDRSVLFFSMEMGADELVKRLISIQGHVDSRVLQAPLELQPYHLEQLPEIFAQVADLPIHIEEDPNPSLTKIRSVIRSVKRKAPKDKPLQVVFIDYLQLMSGNAGGGGETNRVQEIGAITRGLKQLARTENVAMILLSQLSRAIEKRNAGTDAPSKPMLSDLRESGSIEQDADVVMFVHRETAAAEGASLSPSAILPAVVLVEKNRSGQNGPAACGFIGAYMHFVDVVSSEDGPIPPSALDEEEQGGLI